MTARPGSVSIIEETAGAPSHATPRRSVIATSKSPRILSAGSGGLPRVSRIVSIATSCASEVGRIVAVQHFSCVPGPRAILFPRILHISHAGIGAYGNAARALPRQGEGIRSVRSSTMTSLVMIFIVAFLACGAVHWANSDSARSRAEARVGLAKHSDRSVDSRARAGGVARAGSRLKRRPCPGRPVTNVEKSPMTFASPRPPKGGRRRQIPT